jgi:hypothetical protein
MADTTSTQLYDGARNVQLKFTDFSDGTGLTGVTLLDVSTLSPDPGIHIKIRRIRYSIEGMGVRLQWAANSPVDLAILSNGQDILDFSKNYAGGWPVPVVAGASGNVLISTIAAAANSNCVLELEFIKGV